MAAPKARQEVILLGLIALELLVFSVLGSHFFSRANAFEVLRLGVELGLLALCLTPVILTGGIDLSVGSLLGLCAVSFGALWRDAHLPVAVAALLAILIGLAGGAVNAALIARANLPPLIVTLGSYSLYRGMAEGLTGGAENYTGFPAGFLQFGQGYWFGIVPPQTLVLLAFAIGVYVLVHRTTIGRALSAIGYSPAGARYAGLPVGKRIALAYVLSGFAASVAALIYVAHLGQAKSDAGTGYELMAITAVVLGGTSIFGGRGSVIGTLLGLLAIIILQNGLRLAALPTELSGILTGLLLLATIGLDTLGRRPRATKQYGTLEATTEEDIMKNSQVAVLSAVILLGAAIVAGSNVWLVRSLKASPTTVLPATTQTVTVGMMPKAKGDPYFIACRAGAEAAAKERNVEMIWDGPTDLDPAKQNEIVEGWITRHVDVIAVSVENQAALSTVLRKARAAGIGVLTWDADAAPDARDYFINQATPQGIGDTLTDEAARLLNNKGEFAIVTASLSAANQNEWMKYIRQRLAEKYPNMKIAVVRPSDGDRDRAFAETQTILKVYPNVKLIMGIAAPAVPGAAEAVKQSGRSDVKVIGLSLPSLTKSYVHAGIIDAVVLWNTRDLGYLTITAAQALKAGTLHPGVTSLNAGRLGTVEVKGSEVMLGKPFVFRKDNIDQFDF